MQYFVLNVPIGNFQIQYSSGNLFLIGGHLIFTVIYISLHSL